MQLSMSIMMFMMNIIVERVGGIDGVAVFSAGWRVATLATMPLLGLATAVVSVTGAAYGARSFKKLDIAHVYALKIGSIIAIQSRWQPLFLLHLSRQHLLNAADTARIGNDITIFLRIICIFYPATAFGYCHLQSSKELEKGCIPY